MKFILDYDELESTLARLESALKKYGLSSLAARLSVAQNILMRSVVEKALDTRIQVLQRRSPKTSNPVSYNAHSLTKDVSSHSINYFI